MVWYDPRTWRKKEPEPEVITKITPIAPTTTAVRVIDTSEGAVVIKGRGAWGGGGGRTVTGVGMSQAEAERIAKAEGVPSTPEAPTIIPSASPTAPRTIAEQLKEAPPSAMYPYKGEYVIKEPGRYEGMSFWEKIRTTGREYPGTVMEAERKFWEGKPIIALGSLFGPLQKFIPGKTGEIVTEVPWRGTGLGEEYLGTPPGYGPKTEFERLGEQAVVDPSLVKTPGQQSELIGKTIEIGLQEKYGGQASKLAESYQGKIETGKLTLSEAKKEYKKELSELNKKMESEFQEKYEGRYEKWAKKKSAFTGRVVKARAPMYDVKRIGATVSILAMGLTPAGGAAISGAFGMGGLGRIFTGETKREKVVGAGMLGLGLAGVGLSMKAAARQVDIARLESLMAKKQKIAGIELIRGEKGGLFYVRGLKRVGREAELVTQLKMPVFKTGKDVFSITGGKGVSRLRYFSFEKGKWITGKETFKFFGRGYVSELPPSLIRTTDGLKITTQIKDWQGSFGAGGIVRRKEITQFGFGGISKDLEKYFAIAGGKARLGRYGIITGERKALFDIREYGFIKKIPPKEEGFKFIITAGKKSSQKYLQQLYSQQALGGAPAFLKQAQKQFVSSLSPTSFRGGGIVGLGGLLTQQELTEQITKIRPTISEMFAPGQLTKQLQKQQALVIPKLGVWEKQFPIQKVTPLLIQISKQRLKQLQKQKLLQPSRFQPTISPFFKVPFEGWGIGIPPILFPLPKFFRKPGIRRRKEISRVKQPFALTPSLTAVALGLRGPRPKYILGKTKLGVFPGVRFLPRKRKIKRKKRK